MFFDEARLAGLIRHPNVAAALEVGEDGEGPFLLMDYVDGPSVAQIIERVEPRDRLLPVAFCVAVAAQAARGLHAAHVLVAADGAPLSVVHRDISPKNLLVGYDGLVRVADFGIAKASDNVDQTRLGVLKGSVGYMAPEYLRFHEVDGRSDLFALGVVLYEMLTRERLYGGSETSAIARRIIEEPPPDIFDARDVPPELAALLFELMAKERELRPPDALALSARLEDIAAGLAADQGPFDVVAFLQAELAPMREERRALIEAARAGATPEVVAAVPPSRAAATAGASRDDVGGARRARRAHAGNQDARQSPAPALAPAPAGGRRVAARAGAGVGHRGARRAPARATGGVRRRARRAVERRLAQLRAARRPPAVLGQQRQGPARRRRAGEPQPADPHTDRGRARTSRSANTTPARCAPTATSCAGAATCAARSASRPA